ncbi:MAG: copper homeostasis protein CutC [Bacillota bacterium]
MIKEFCAENYTDLEKAIHQDIDRIELCDALAVGGTTPSYGVIEQSVILAKQHNVDVVVMIRPRQGDFCYNEMERKIMERDIDVAFQLGATGVVFGCLTKENTIDVPMMKKLVDKVNNRGEIVFHMAFDQITSKEKYQAIDQLIMLNVTRVLLHGSDSNQSVLDNAKEVNDYIRYADHNIDFIVGGGVTKDNIDKLQTIVHTNQFHGTKIVKL